MEDANHVDMALTDDIIDDVLFFHEGAVAGADMVGRFADVGMLKQKRQAFFER